ncbi:S8 family serine peptidase [Lacimicrobium alkaliphilum]|uniref:Ig-like domain-containing protein n=1 Tax=Lacimicrobium alkaliphilum TaxID=1526571 RepID=A0A0U3AIB6_9ALTE|nr:S8 family serine peptidase [Lacimicrobium alkaliphilum]ALS98449.1 hypothetical protein AT746_09380 [Lacimicrobium alkaliphilum]
MNMPMKMLSAAVSACLLLQSAALSQGMTKPQLSKQQNKFAKEPGLAAGVYTYIVRLQSPSVAALSRQFNKTGPQSTLSTDNLGGFRRLDASSSQVQRYAATLRQQQQDFLARIPGSIRAKAPLANFQYALNALVLELTQKQAAEIARLPEVAFVERSRLVPLNSDSGPGWTGADLVWSGQQGQEAFQGEGIIVGVLDTGINTDHPSFSETAGDGYQHQNPLGTYLGDCVSEPALCNNKLIGVYSYDRITSQYDDFAPGTPEVGEDYNGHGSHVAGVAAGNVLLNQPLLDASGDAMPDFTFDRIAGIAPRANIISYQVCEPGEDDSIGFSGCWTDLVVAAVEQAIIDGVDVLNHSIGAELTSPWQGSKGLAFLNAREAGVIVTHSAGNSGPQPETASSDASAPWVLTVGAYTHDRVFSSKTLNSFSGGDTAAPSTIEGEGKTAGISAAIVYAGDFTNPNGADGDPAQCLQPFPAGTFNGEIVLCERGEIARVDKGKHVKAGGAGGMVLANIDGGAENLVADNHVLPAIQITAADGNALRSWLASGTGHQARISASEIGSEPELANIAADFTSRGPNNLLSDVITPSMVAPGVEIWSAYADEQPEGFKDIPDPADFAFLSGTSMAAPSVAGAAALLRGLHPDWSAAEIQSALMLTANPVTFKEDGVTLSDPFDMGSGMLNVSAAAQSGLVMDISIAEYQAANPDNGGEPAALNLASVADADCFSSCSWIRRLKGTQSDSWVATVVNTNSAAEITVLPEQFSIDASEVQTLSIAADASSATEGEWVFASVQLESSTGQKLSMPVAVQPKLTTLPEHLVIEARRDADSLLIDDVRTVDIEDLTVRSYGLTVAQSQQDQVAEDSDNADVFDDLNDGVATFTFNLPPQSKRFIVEITQSQAPDLDLWLGRDANNDGIAQESELVTLSAGSTALEKIELALPDAGNYWVLVQNWQGSGSAKDGFTLSHAIVDGSQSDNLTLSGPQSVSAQQPFTLRVGWDLDMQTGDKVYGALDLGTDTDVPGNLGLFLVDLTRQEDDVTLSLLSAQRVQPGDQVSYQVRVAANPDSENRSYRIDAHVPDNTQLLSESVSGDFSLTENGIRWQVLKAAGTGGASILSFTLQIDDDHPGGPVDVSLSSQLPQHPGTKEEQHAPTPRVQVEGPPQVLINNQNEASISATSGDSVTLMATASDPNDDPLTVSWQQTSGSSVTFDQTVLQPSVRLPVVSSPTTLGFQVTVTDQTGLSSQANVLVTVNPRAAQNNSGSGGGSLSLSLWAVLLLALSRIVIAASREH